jgi:hypothetical protein
MQEASGSIQHVRERKEGRKEGRKEYAYGVMIV